MSSDVTDYIDWYKLLTAARVEYARRVVPACTEIGGAPRNTCFAALQPSVHLEDHECDEKDRKLTLRAARKLNTVTPGEPLVVFNVTTEGTIGEMSIVSARIRLAP